MMVVSIKLMWLLVEVHITWASLLQIAFLLIQVKMFMPPSLLMIKDLVWLNFTEITLERQAQLHFKSLRLKLKDRRMC